MPPGSGPRKGAVLAEKPQLQVKTTETGHVACHLLLLTWGTRRAPTDPAWPVRPANWN